MPGLLSAAATVHCSRSTVGLPTAAAMPDKEVQTVAVGKRFSIVHCVWRTYYGILTEDELNEVMPDPNSVDSKRTWETAMANARIKLRELAKGRE